MLRIFCDIFHMLVITNFFLKIGNNKFDLKGGKAGT